LQTLKKNFVFFNSSNLHSIFFKSQ
jgi:hypothetical protein